ncbi:hypothetical protein FOA52_012460 [Chlamydomonas sp. UWO 241]|nr:hypothetical protein FOA52_012460 [Chlamydomonas sp. UWO 241]
MQPGTSGVKRSSSHGYSVSEMLRLVKYLKAVALTTDAANALLGPHLRHVPCDGELSILLGRNFPWDAPSRSFVNTNSAPGCCDTLDLVKLVYLLQQHLYQRQPGELGSGSYSVVISAINRDTGERVALKKLKYCSQDSGFEKSVVREIGMLRELAHENIVSLRDVMTTMMGRSVYLVLECMECNLRTYLDNTSTDVRTAKILMYQIVRGLDYIHAHSIMHRDLKPQNVLVSAAPLTVKLTDFGLARHYMPFGQQYTGKVITLYYRAPELLLGHEQYNFAVDMWSAGCVLAEMLSSEPLFVAETEIGLLERLVQIRGVPSREEWPAFHEARLSFGGGGDGRPPVPLAQVIPCLAGDDEGIDLLARLLCWNPERRISARAALRHPWFDDVRSADHAHEQASRTAAASAAHAHAQAVRAQQQQQQQVQVQQQAQHWQQA